MQIKRGDVAHRYIALTILLIVVYSLYLLIISLLTLSSDSKQRYDDAQFQLNKYQVMAAKLSQVEADNLNLLKLAKNDDRYIVATSPSLAAAALQKTLQRIIQQSEINLISMQPVYSEAQKGVNFVPVKLLLQLRLKNDALVKLLYQLETQKTVGFIEQLRIQSQAQYGLNMQNKNDRLLELRMEYTAFMVNLDAS